MLGNEQHGAADAVDAGSALDDLQGGAQGLARGAEGTRDLAVGLSHLDNHAAQVEVVLRHQVAGLVDGHALLLAKLGQCGGIVLALGIVERVHDGGLVDVGQSPLVGQLLDVGGITNENNVRKVVGQGAVGSLQSTLLLCFGEHDALLVCFGARNDLL